MRAKLGAMREQQASRTLLKSPPELWAECSDAQSLAKHLGEFGEIRINKLEPEHTVAWEGDRASGTVKLEPSGWGTRVTLTYSAPGAEEVPPEPKLEPKLEPEPQHQPAPEPPHEPEPEANAALTSEQPPAGHPRGRLFERVLRFLAPERGTTGPVAREPSAPAPPPSKPEPPATAPAKPEPAAPQPAASDAPPPQPARATETSDALAAALDSLGQAHHRPFSRA